MSTNSTFSQQAFGSTSRSGLRQLLHDQVGSMLSTLMRVSRRRPLQPNCLDPRSANERGAALVEAAFITPMLIMLLLGTVTASMAYSQHTSLQTAAREASRFGASLPVSGSMDAWLNSVVNVARGAANADLAGSVPGQFICVAYVYPNGATPNDRTTRVIQSGGVTGVSLSGPTAVCFDDGRPNDERRVQVVTRRSATIEAVLFSVDVDLRTPAVTRFERGS